MQTRIDIASANQCPYAGGQAVYIARGLLRVVNDSIEYYDDIVCLQAGYYRAIINTTYKQNNIKLQPNPTNDNVEIYAVNPTYTPSTIEIYNGIGELIYKGKSEIGVLLKTIDVSGYAPGVYSIRVLENDQLYLDKLVIIK